ncbi:MAG: DNA methylase, partial [Bacteroidetes bacterium]|nr:DNA methylase [Bacteroidota bacterium]
FGINAEFLIDHAWGYEPCTIKLAKSFKPQSNSLSHGQVLHEPYNYNDAMLIVQEMIDQIVLELVKKRLVTDQIVLTIGYDIENLKNREIKTKYKGEIASDYYGRQVPKPAHGTARIDHKTSSTQVIMENVIELYKKIVNPILLIRRINIAACNVVDEAFKEQKPIETQENLFENDALINKKRKLEAIDEKKEGKVQKAIIKIREKYGNNSILKGMNYKKGATARERNEEVGGHKG